MERTSSWLPKQLLLTFDNRIFFYDLPCSIHSMRPQQSHKEPPWKSPLFAPSFWASPSAQQASTTTLIIESSASPRIQIMSPSPKPSAIPCMERPLWPECRRWGCRRRGQRWLRSMAIRRQCCLSGPTLPSRFIPCIARRCIPSPRPTIPSPRPWPRQR